MKKVILLLNMFASTSFAFTKPQCIEVLDYLLNQKGLGTSESPLHVTSFDKKKLAFEKKDKKSKVALQANQKDGTIETIEITEEAQSSVKKIDHGEVTQKTVIEKAKTIIILNADCTVKVISTDLSTNFNPSKLSQFRPTLSEITDSLFSTKYSESISSCNVFSQQVESSYIKSTRQDLCDGIRKINLLAKELTDNKSKPDAVGLPAVDVKR